MERRTYHTAIQVYKIVHDIGGGGFSQVEGLLPTSPGGSASFARVGMLGIHGNLLKWFNYYPTNRSQRVMINGQFSEWLPVLSGVPQGSILGPLICYLYCTKITKNNEFKKGVGIDHFNKK